MTGSDRAAAATPPDGRLFVRDNLVEGVVSDGLLYGQDPLVAVLLAARGHPAVRDLFTTGKTILRAVLRIRIWDTISFWSLDPGWVKNQGPDLGSGSCMNNPDHISESLETIFGLKCT